MPRFERVTTRRGRSAVPRTLMEGFERHGVRILQAWGMTETSPLCTVGTLRTQHDDMSEDERAEQVAAVSQQVRDRVE